jgi:hypothetical protein
VRNNLQVQQARKQNQYQDAREHEHHDGPGHDQPGFKKIVLECCRIWHLVRIPHRGTLNNSKLGRMGQAAVGTGSVMEQAGFSPGITIAIS